MKVNPRYVPARDQGMRVFTAAIAGPALMYAGYKYPGGTQSRVALVAIGAALVYANYGSLLDALYPDQGSSQDSDNNVALEQEPEPEFKLL